MFNAKLFAVICLSGPALFYIAQAANYYLAQGRVGMCVAFVSYTCANIGLLMDFYGI